MNSIGPIERGVFAATNRQRLHHIGFVVASISPTVERFARSVAASWDGQIIHDPLQAVRVAFLRPGSSEGPLIELVEPAGPESPVSSFVTRGGGLHHLCYEVDVLDAQLEFARSIGGLVVRSPSPAVAFGGRRIAWIYTAQRLLLEYLDR